MGRKKLAFLGKNGFNFFRLGTAWGVHGSRGMADAEGGEGGAPDTGPGTTS